MKATCDHACGDSWIFPKRPDNRPSLDRIQYRIANYADFRAHLMRQLNNDVALSAWTYREADDPGIALLEGAAMLGDVLTFYQNTYANEAFLRTAQWRESIAELVRLLGYRLSPGLGGSGKFAFEITGEKSVTIPQGFAVKGQLEGSEQTAEFETKSEAVAYPELSLFELYRPLQAAQITHATKEFYIDFEESGCDPIKLEAGDRLLIGQAFSSGGETEALRNSEILIVESTRELHGKQVIKISGTLQKLNDLDEASAFKLGRTFNHFGQNSLPDKITVDGSGNVSTDGVSYLRKLNKDTTESVSPTLNNLEWPLDQEVNDLAAGSSVLFRFPTREYYSQGENIVEVGNLNQNDIVYTRVRTITEVRKQSYTWGTTSGGASTLIIAEALCHQADHQETQVECGGCPGCEGDGTSSSTTQAHYFAADIREMQIHETKSPRLTVYAVPKELEVTDNKTLVFYGSENAAQALKNRIIAAQTADGVVYECSVLDYTAAVTGFEAYAQAWLLYLSSEVDLEDFPHIENETVVYGNLVEATQGKTQKEKILGNGDNREKFQSFKLPKTPLTYYLDAIQTPPEVPELEIYVNDRQWTFVTSLFGHGPKEEIYIVREDEEGTSWVQFGDGKTGVRLPSGVDNVKAIYRTGSGAAGALKEDTKVQAGARLDRLKSIYLPGLVEGGSEPETGDNAKAAAPGKVQSLGRLVSLKDYETETLALSGVAKVAASWGLPPSSNVPAILLTVLMENGSENTKDSVETTLKSYNSSRGPDRYSVHVEEGEYKYITLGLKIGYDSTYQTDDIKLDVLQALGVFGADSLGLDSQQGLFSLYQRAFGEQEYRSRILGVVQNVAGVLWAEMTSLDELGVSSESGYDDFAAETESANNLEVIHCDDQEQILSLYYAHAFVTFVNG